MYLYVFNQDVYDQLNLLGQQYLREMEDINGRKIWIFAVNEQTKKFAFQDGCIQSPELHMAF